MSTPSPGNPYAPPTARVADVAEPGARVELAGLEQRLAAFLIDLVIGIASYTPALVVAYLHWNPAQPWILNFINGGTTISAVLGLILLIITIVLVARYGQTIGKRIVGIRVARPNGSKASLGRIFWLRNVVNDIAGSFLGGFLAGFAAAVAHVTGIFPLLLGYLYPLADSLAIFGGSRQCLHDRIANTIVVKA